MQDVKRVKRRVAIALGILAIVCQTLVYMGLALYGITEDYVVACVLDVSTIVLVFAAIACFIGWRWMDTPISYSLFVVLPLVLLSAFGIFNFWFAAGIEFAMEAFIDCRIYGLIASVPASILGLWVGKLYRKNAWEI